MLPGLPEPRITKMDCGSCRKCCRQHEAIVLTEQDDARQYQCRELAPGILALDRHPNGDCIYLGETGCTIWGKHPVVCRVFNCMDFVKRLDEGAFDYAGRRFDNDVVREGRRRLRKAGKP